MTDPLKWLKDICKHCKETYVKSLESDEEKVDACKYCAVKDELAIEGRSCS